MDFFRNFCEYFIIRDSIVNKELKYLKYDLIHILFRGYLLLFKDILKYINTQKLTEEHKQFLRLKMDFIIYDEYYEIIEKLITYLNMILEQGYNKFSNNEELLSLFLFKKEVTISKYSFEVFLIFMERKKICYFQNYYLNNNYNSIKFKDYNFLDNKNKIHYHISKKKILDFNKAVNKINNSLIEDDFVFFTDLLKLKNTNFLKISDFKLNIFPKKWDYYYILAKNYYNIIDEFNVLSLILNDINNKVCYYKISYDFTLIILGYNTGKLKIYFLKEKNKFNEDKQKYFLSGRDILFDKKFKLNNQIKMMNLLGHKSTITSINLNYNNEIMLSSDCSADIRLWRIGYSECIKVFKYHLNIIWDTDLSDRGNHFLSCSEDCKAIFWNINSEYPLKVLDFKEFIPFSCKLSYNMKYAIFGCFDNNVFVYDLDGYNLIRYLNMTISLNFIKLTKFLSYYIIVDDKKIIISYYNEENKNLTIELGEKIMNIEFNFDESFIYIFTEFSIFVYEINNLTYNLINKVSTKNKIKYGMVNCFNMPIIIFN